MQQEFTQEKNNKIVAVLLCLTCLFTNLSQLPYFVNKGLTQIISMPLWIILFVYCLATKRLLISRTVLRILGAFCFLCFGLLLMSIFTTNDYFSSSMFTSLFISLFVLAIGNLIGREINDKVLKKVCLAYVLSTLIVSFFIYIEYFSSGFNLASMIYSYSSKNSISQVIFTAIIILMFYKFNFSKIVNILRVVTILFLLFVMMILRSRATIVGFIACVLYILLTKTSNKKLKYFLLFCVVLVVILIFKNETFHNIFVNDILFAARDKRDLNALTSGRVAIIKSFPYHLDNHWFTGIGAIYFEAFPLSAILNFGIILGVLVIAIAYCPIFYALKWRRRSEFTEMFLFICIGYIINSLFEGLAPIGPGVKCYFMWLMFGILLKNVSRCGCVNSTKVYE